MASYQVRATWPGKDAVMCLGTEGGSEADAVARAALVAPKLMRGARIEVERIPSPGERVDTIAG